MATAYDRLNLLKVVNISDTSAIFEANHSLYGSVKAKRFKCLDLQALSSALNEAFLQAKLHHKSICQAVDLIVAVADEGYELLICMENLPSDLQKEIKDRGDSNTVYSEAHLMAFAKDLTDALAAAQAAVTPSQSICHRDIKPSNIFIDSEGRYKVGDLGEAKAVKNEVTLTSLRGTVAYMSPECLQAHGLDKSKLEHNPYKSDVYSLGMTLLSMALLTVYETTEQVQALSDRKAALVAELPYSEQFKALLTTMLAPESKSRPDFIQLQQLIAGFKGSAAAKSLFDAFNDVLPNIATEIDQHQKATSSLAAALERAWALGLLGLWQVQTTTPPKFYYSRTELLQAFSAPPLNYRLLKRVAEHPLDYIRIDELLEENSLAQGALLTVEKREGPGLFQSICTVEKSIQVCSVDQLLVRRRGRNVSIAETGSEWPRIMQKLDPNQPHYLHVSDLYAVGEALISILDIKPEQLTVCLPPLVDTPYVFSAGTDVGIGSKAESTLCLAVSGVSGRHAVIRSGGGCWSIADTGSRNGTWKCVQSWSTLSHLSREAQVKDGAVVTAAECEYRFSLQ